MTPDQFAAYLDATPAAPIAPPDVPDLGLAAGVPLPPAPPPMTFEQAAEKAQREGMLESADKRTGAPPEVRLAVGSSSDDASRLARIKKYYPDAEAVPGTSNFVYTDPETQSRRTYAPIGWRWPSLGDVASLAPEAAEAVGGVLGGLGGTVVGGPGVGTAVGAGSGAIGAKEATERGIAKFLGMPDLRTPEQQVAEAGTTGLVNAVLPGATDAAGRIVAKGLLAPGAGTATQQAARSLSDAGVAPGLLERLPTGVASESRALQRIESGIMQTPGGGGIGGRYADTGEALREGVQTLAGRNIVPPQGVPPPDTFGNTLQSIANDAIADKLATGTALKTTLQQQLGGAPVDFGNLRSTMAMLNARKRVAPSSMANVFDEALTHGDNVLSDASARGGTLPFANVLQQRTLANNMPDWATTGGAANILDSPMKQVATAIRQDLYDSAWNAGGPAGRPGYQALTDYDSFWRSYMNGPKDTLDRLAKDTTGKDTLQQTMMGTTPKAQSDMMHLWAAATPEQKGVLQGGVLQNLGDTGNGFDMGRFNTNWKKLNQPQKDLMFGTGPGSLGESLDNLSTVQSAIRDQATTRGHSNTAAVWAVMTMLGTAGGHLMAGEPGTAAGALAGPIGGPWAAGRLLQSRPFVNAVTGTWGVNPSTAGWWGRQVGRLAAAGEADPAIADLLDQHIKSLPPEPQTTGDGRVIPGTVAR